MRTCESCGTTNEGTKFCLKCGRPTATPIAPTTDAPSSLAKPLMPAAPYLPTAPSATHAKLTRRETAFWWTLGSLIAGAMVWTIAALAITQFSANLSDPDTGLVSAPETGPDVGATRPNQQENSSTCTDEQGCDDTSVEVSQPQVQTVVMPDLTGAQVSEAKTWLRANLPGVTVVATYDGNASSECRGFDQGYIQSQTPRAGTEVTLPKTVFVKAVC
jgi:hypothetical protein